MPRDDLIGLALAGWLIVMIAVFLILERRLG